MSLFKSPKYRQLAIDSSNDMIEHDASRMLGRFVVAEEYARKAGMGRLDMGKIMLEGGEFTHAAEDYLLAGACFCLSRDRQAIKDKPATPFSPRRQRTRSHRC